jgi:hypothetical protein
MAEKGLEVVVVNKEICGAQSAVQAERGLGVTNQSPSRASINTKCSAGNTYEQASAEPQNALAELCFYQIEGRPGRPLSVVSCWL